MSGKPETRDGFDQEFLIDRLERFPQLLESVVDWFERDDLRWKPDQGSWSVLEVVCHLADEEYEDFPKRIFDTLDDPTRAWSSIDPEGWAVERSYSAQDIRVQLERFRSKRQENLDELERLVDPRWENTHIHKQIGELSAKDLLASWCAHDCLHLRQLTKRMYQVMHHRNMDADTRYAGSW